MRSFMIGSRTPAIASGLILPRRGFQNVVQARSLTASGFVPASYFQDGTDVRFQRRAGCARTAGKMSALL